jgi:hypothetical protein
LLLPFLFVLSLLLFLAREAPSHDFGRCSNTARDLHWRSGLCRSGTAIVSSTVASWFRRLPFANEV